MKTIKTYFIIALAGCMALTGCEMKNELMGDKTEGLPHGTLELGVTLKKSGITTKNSEVTTPSTDKFPVSIVGISTGITEVKKDFASLTEVPKPLRLPVGTYKVSSHSPMELKQQMDEAYYAGEQTMTIQANITSETTVKCTMQNNRISLSYGEDFKKSFKSWTITLDDGLNHVLTYNEKNLAPKDVFWLFEKDKVEAITANITAVTTSGNTITASRKMIKAEAAGPQGIDEEYFVGGDAIQIPMGVEESLEGTITGITIKPSINFDNDNKDEFVELPTVDATPEPPVVDPEQPTPPAGDGPTLTFEKGAANITYISDNEISYSLSNAPEKFDATLTAETTFDKIVVKIDAGNTAFKDVIADLNGLDFATGVDIVKNTTFENILAMVEAVCPTKKDSTYTFPIGAFFTFLNITGATDEGKAHTFTITITDANGKTCTDTLKIHITE